MNDKKHSFVRVRLQFLRHIWQDATERQRTAWKQAALEYPWTNRLGIKTHLNGHQLFIRVNQLGAIDEGPNATNFQIDPPSFTAGEPAVERQLIVISGGTKTLEFFTPLPTAVNVALVYGARTLSTIDRPNWFNFRFLGQRIVLFNPPDTKVASFTAQWDDRIGDPQVGEQCWLKYRFITIGAYPSQEFITSTFATA